MMHLSLFFVGSLALYTVQGSAVRSLISEPEEISEMFHLPTSADLLQSLPHPETLQPLTKNAVQERSRWSNFFASIIRESWVASMSYLKSDNHLPLVVGVIGLAAMLILMQVM